MSAYIQFLLCPLNGSIVPHSPPSWLMSSLKSTFLTAMCYFVKNVMKFLKGLLRTLFFLLELMANPGSN